MPRLKTFPVASRHEVLLFAGPQALVPVGAHSQCTAFLDGKLCPDPDKRHACRCANFFYYQKCGAPYPACSS